MTQIYKENELVLLYGEAEGRRRWRQRVNEVVLWLGKGSGKNLSTSIAVAYVVYQLLCLKDPQAYYDKPHGDSIDILNIAINSKQAENVFFKPLVDRIKRCPWFEGKYETRQGELIFDKNIRCFSGHSEKESWEGYNLLIAVLDEIAGFAIESTSGSQSAKTARDIYDMYKASVQSRFPKYGKTILLSFARFKGDFITTRYDEVVLEKKTIEHVTPLVLNPELPAGTPGNEFEVKWEEDEVLSYKEPRVYAMRKPTWIVNPTVEIEDFTNDFFRDPVQTLSRFGCMPPEAVDAFFKNQEAVRRCFPERPGPFLPDSWVFARHFKAKPDTSYFVHVDLAEKHDRAAVAMTHVEKWVRSKYNMRDMSPYVVVDALRWWTPTSDANIDFSEIKEYIWHLRSLGFDIELVTFDRWNSASMMRELNEEGISAKRLSVNKQHYSDLALAVYEQRLEGYHIDLLIDELLGLRIIKGDKIDHPRKGSNDLADALAGAVYNAVQHAEHSGENVLEVYTPQQPPKPVLPAEERKASAPPPAALAEFIQRMRTI